MVTQKLEQMFETIKIWDSRSEMLKQKHSNSETNDSIDGVKNFSADKQT